MLVKIVRTLQYFMQEPFFLGRKPFSIYTMLGKRKETFGLRSPVTLHSAGTLEIWLPVLEGWRDGHED